MKTDIEIKELVREEYGGIARSPERARWRQAVEPTGSNLGKECRVTRLVLRTRES